MKRSKHHKLYAVHRGREGGVYHTWEECLAAVDGYAHAKYRSFRPTDRVAAEQYARTGLVTAGDTTTLLPGTIVVYTDGSERGGRAGIGVHFPGHEYTDLSEPLPGERQTNQRAEIWAIVRALEVVPRHLPVQIRTDSAYCCAAYNDNWMRNWTLECRWPLVTNADLFRRFELATRTRRSDGTLTIVKVKAHSGDPGNDAADALAARAVVRAPGTLE